MNGMLQKVLLILVLIPLLLLIFFIQTAELQIFQSKKGSTDHQSEPLCAREYSAKDLISHHAHVFYNRIGLKDEISIYHPLRELRAVAPSKTETVEDLIENLSIWVPTIYFEQFLVYPRCIIILETGINDDGKAEVRFGVAMECTYKSTLPDQLSI